MLKSEDIFPKRLKEARELRGMNMVELADKLGITRQAISQFENGTKKPSADVLSNIIRTLNVPVNFFTSERLRKDDRKTPLSFRKLNSANIKMQKQVEQYENLLADIYEFLNSYFDLSQTNLPTNDVDDFENLSREMIEEIAVNTRKFWGLGDGPISNLLLLLENNGLILTKIKIADKLDACSCWRNNVGIMILSKNKPTAVRLRFDAAHELGHLILHKYIDEDEIHDPKIHKLMEQQANQFASSFLLPSTSFPNELITPSLNGFIMLKERWGVSIQAMIMRYHELGYINDYQKTYLFKKCATFRTKEPLDDLIKHEDTSSLKRAFQMLIDNNISTDSILNSLKINISDLIELTNTNLEIFNVGVGNVVELRPKF